MNKNNKKIALFFNKFEDCNFTSGGEKVNYLILRSLYDQGIDFDVFCNEMYASGRNLPYNVYEQRNDLLEQRRRENYYEFVFSENFRPYDINYVHENSRVYRNVVILSPVARFIKMLFRPSRYLKHQKQVLKDKDILKNMKRIIVPSTYIKEDLITYMECEPEKIAVISPPVDLAFDEIAQNINENFTFGLVARSFELKGGYDFLLALSLLKLKKKKFDAKIIAPRNNKVLKMFMINLVTFLLGIHKNVEYCDFGSKIQDFYSLTDCIVMPSNRDAFGLVGAEAMSCGLPVIISSRCGLKDYVKDSENGYIYEFGKNNFYKLYKKMLYVLENRDNLEELKQNAKESSEQFSREIFKNKITDTIKSLLQ